MDLALLALAGFLASVLNALAGGGALLTLPALILSGLDPRAANMTSIVALFPGQIAIAWAAREAAAGVASLSLRMLLAVALAGGLAGALLLVATPSSLFSAFVPWLIAFSTLVFALEPRFAPVLRNRIWLASPSVVMFATFATSVYGGYFGGGVGFVIIALLSLTGASARAASATKNACAVAFNAAAVAAYAVLGDLDPERTIALAAGGLAGGFAGAGLVLRLPETLLRRTIVALGLALTVWLFLRNAETGIS